MKSKCLACTRRSRDITCRSHCSRNSATRPMFRRFMGFTAFVEGWGLYSERLGYDMGLYQDPYSRFRPANL